MKVEWKKETEWGKMESKPLIQTAEEYGEFITAIRGRRLVWLPKFVKLCTKYYEDERFCKGGSLSRVLEDCDIEDTTVAWCAGYAHGLHDTAGEQLASLLLLMSFEQRRRVVVEFEDA